MQECGDKQTCQFVRSLHQPVCWGVPEHTVSHTSLSAGACLNTLLQLFQFLLLNMYPRQPLCLKGCFMEITAFAEISKTFLKNFFKNSKAISDWSIETHVDTLSAVNQLAGQMLILACL